MPERCCLTNQLPADWETGEIQRRVSQSELIEPLGARKNLTKLLFTLRCTKPPTKAGRTGQPERADLPKQLTKQPLNFNLLRKARQPGFNAAWLAEAFLTLGATKDAGTKGF